MKISSHIKSNIELYSLLKTMYTELPITEAEVSIIYTLHKKHRVNFCVVNHHLYTLKFGATNVSKNTHPQSIQSILQRSIDWLNNDVSILTEKMGLAVDAASYAVIRKELRAEYRRLNVLKEFAQIVRSRISDNIEHLYDVVYAVRDYTDVSMVYVEIPSNSNGKNSITIYEIQVKCDANYDNGEEVYINEIQDFDMNYILSNNNRYYRLSNYLPTLLCQRMNTLEFNYEDVVLKAKSILSHFSVLKSEMKYMDYFEGIIYAIENGVSLGFCTEKIKIGELKKDV